MNEMKEEWKRFTKGDKISLSIHIILLVGFLAILIWWGYFTDEVHNLATVLNIGKSVSGMFYFILIFLGLIKLLDSWCKFANLFYPTDKRYKEKKKQLFKKYPYKVANLEYKKWLKELELKKIYKKIEKEKK